MGIYEIFAPGSELTDQELELLVDEVFKDFVAKFFLTGKNKIRARIVSLHDEIGMTDDDNIEISYTSGFNLGYIRAKMGRLKSERKVKRSLWRRVLRLK